MTSHADLRILLAELDDITRLFLADNLTADGYEVQAVTDRDAALDQLVDGDPDLLLVDVNGDTLALLDALVDHPVLRGPLPSGATGRLLRLDDTDPDTEWAFRRRSCCLYVRAPGGGTCGDCVLAGRA